MAEYVEVMKNKKRMCESYQECGLCDLSHRNNGFNMICNDMELNHPQETEEIIMGWAKEHLAKTNADKFKEVFGLEANNTPCPFSATDFCQEDWVCYDCELDGFWNKEYKAPGENE